jgi:hypothetical protein
MRRILTAGVCATLLAGCSDSPAAPDPVTSLSITNKEPFVVVSDTVTVPIRTVGGGEGSVRWESLDPQVATVDGNGRVTGVARGSARIVARADALADTARVGVLRNSFNVSTSSFCETPENTTVRIAAVGQRAIILADTRNPAGGYTDAEYRAFAEEFDNVIYPTVTGAFGEPRGRDGTGRFMILFTRAVNAMTSDPERGWIGGFVWLRDLLPRAGGVFQGVNFGGPCPGSNEVEMTYMAIPDPTWSEPIRNTIRRRASSTIAHEYQHLINGSRRVFEIRPIELEDLWLNEGMSHIAEELMFFGRGGIAPGEAADLNTIRATQARVDAFNNFNVGNFGNLGRYLERPDTLSPMMADTAVSFEVRGAAWNLLRYAADRRGGNQTTFWRSLLSSSATGMENLEQSIGTAVLPWVRDWNVSLYLSGLAPAPEARFRQNWNLRSILPALRQSGTYPLRTQPLQDQVPASLTVRAGSAAFLSFGVAAGQTGVLTVAAGTNPPATCRDTNAVTNLGLWQVYTGPAGSGEALCLAGGESGRDYTVIPFHASGTPNAQLILTVTGQGIQAPANATGAAAASGAFGRALVFDASALARDDAAAHGSGALHLRMLKRQQEELARRISGMSSGPRSPFATQSAAAATNGGPLMISVVRTR